MICGARIFHACCPVEICFKLRTSSDTHARKRHICVCVRRVRVTTEMWLELHARHSLVHKLVCVCVSVFVGPDILELHHHHHHVRACVRAYSGKRRQQRQRARSIDAFKLLLPLVGDHDDDDAGARCERCACVCRSGRVLWRPRRAM